MQVNFKLEELNEFLNVLKDVNIIGLYITNEMSYLIYNTLHIFKTENNNYETFNNTFL